MIGRKIMPSALKIQILPLYMCHFLIASFFIVLASYPIIDVITTANTIAPSILIGNA